MKKKLALTLLVALLVVTMLSACNKDNDDGEPGLSVTTYSRQLFASELSFTNESGDMIKIATDGTAVVLGENANTYVVTADNARYFKIGEEYIAYSINDSLTVLTYDGKSFTLIPARVSSIDGKYVMDGISIVIHGITATIKIAENDTDNCTLTYNSQEQEWYIHFDTFMNEQLNADYKINFTFYGLYIDISDYLSIELYKLYSQEQLQLVDLSEHVGTYFDVTTRLYVTENGIHINSLDAPSNQVANVNDGTAVMISADEWLDDEADNGRYVIMWAVSFDDNGDLKITEYEGKESVTATFTKSTVTGPSIDGKYVMEGADIVINGTTATIKTAENGTGDYTIAYNAQEQEWYIHFDTFMNEQLNADYKINLTYYGLYIEIPNMGTIAVYKLYSQEQLQLVDLSEHLGSYIGATTSLYVTENGISVNSVDAPSNQVANVNDGTAVMVAADEWIGDEADNGRYVIMWAVSFDDNGDLKITEYEGKDSVTATFAKSSATVPSIDGKYAMGDKSMVINGTTATIKTAENGTDDYTLTYNSQEREWYIHFDTFMNEQLNADYKINFTIYGLYIDISDNLSIELFKLYSQEQLQLVDLSEHVGTYFDVTTRLYITENGISFDNIDSTASPVATVNNGMVMMESSGNIPEFGNEYYFVVWTVSFDDNGNIQISDYEGFSATFIKFPADAQYLACHFYTGTYASQNGKNIIVSADGSATINGSESATLMFDINGAYYFFDGTYYEELTIANYPDIVITCRGIEYTKQN